MLRERKSSPFLVFFLVAAVVTLALVVAPWLLAGEHPNAAIIAEGGGTTIIQGGTGAPGFVPVLTKLGFHAEQTSAGVTGSFECLALAPEAPTGAHSGQFTVNAMYVTGRVSGATAEGDTATLTGTADVTGLGAGSNLSFTFVARRGGPGATFVLTISGLTFHEVLLEGASQVNGKN
jgi:hypothetical protein